MGAGSRQMVLCAVAGAIAGWIGFVIGGAGDPTAAAVDAPRPEPHADRVAAADPAGADEKAGVDAWLAKMEEGNYPGARGAAFCGVVESLERENISDHAGQIMDLMRGDQMAEWAFIERWVTLDPDGAAAFFESELANGADSSRNDKLALLGALLAEAGEGAGTTQAWALSLKALRDPKGAVVAALNSDLPEDEWAEVFGQMFKMMGARAGDAFPEVNAVEAWDKRERLLKALFTQWVRSDPYGAFDDVIGNLQAGSYAQEEALALVGKSWLPALDGIPALRGDLPARMRDAFVSALVEADPAVTMRWALSGGAGDKAVDGVASVKLSSLADPAAVATLVERRQSEGSWSDTRFLRRWFETDADAALQWMERNEGWWERLLTSGDPRDPFGVFPADPFSFSNATQATGSSVAPALALATAERGWVEVEQIANRLTGVHRASYIVESLPFLQSGPELDRARDFVESYEGELQVEIELALLKRMAIDDVGEALDQGERVSDEALTEFVRVAAAEHAREVFEALSQTDRGAEVLDDPEVAGQLFRGWTAYEPETAMRVAVELGTSSGAGAAMGRWAYWEPDRASEFLRDQMLPGPVRDAAVAALVHEIRDEDPTGAMAWAREIGDEAIRFHTMDSLTTE